MKAHEAQVAEALQARGCRFLGLSGLLTSKLSPVECLSSSLSFQAQEKEQSHAVQLQEREIGPKFQPFPANLVFERVVMVFFWPL